ncbi:MAG: AraC family transcriptional regulator [Proteobacteria bacterium]|nr:MAG: AraC family transcriptional regulator [Pseudomonadota bacterium]PIE40125.1 MAG: AraC family transcriptional regulator [Gammaproteobacteria bacterium]
MKQGLLLARRALSRWLFSSAPFPSALLSPMLPRSMLVCFMLFASIPAWTSEGRSLGDQVKQLKSEVRELNRELYQLEESLINPANTQIAVFLSLSVNNAFDLDSVEIKIDGNTATTYLYRESELTALKKGGIQRLYIGNLSSGAHTISAVLNGQGESEQYFRREKNYSFEKTSKPTLLELQIVNSRRNGEPEFNVKEW